MLRSMYPDSDRAIFNSLATNRTFLNCDYCPTLCVVCNVSSAPDFPPSGEKNIFICVFDIFPQGFQMIPLVNQT